MTDLRADWTDFHDQNCLPPTGIVQTPLVPWIMWMIWKARNKFVFENYAGNPAETVKQVILAAKEWEVAQMQMKKEKRTQAGSPTTQSLVTTITRSDAAWSERNMNAGLSWVVQTSEMKTRGQRGSGFIPSAFVAEGLALRDAMLACQRLGVKEVRFESDSAQLIRAIRREEQWLELYGILEDIIRISSEFDVVEFVWISRLKNVEADMYAKQALCLFEQEVGEAGLMLVPN